jgi:hypothetical protein
MRREMKPDPSCLIILKEICPKHSYHNEEVYCGLWLQLCCHERGHASSAALLLKRKCDSLREGLEDCCALFWLQQHEESKINTNMLICCSGGGLCLPAASW